MAVRPFLKRARVERAREMEAAPTPASRPTPSPFASNWRMSPLFATICRQAAHKGARPVAGSPVEMTLESKTALGWANNWRGHMGTWTTKFRKPALIAGVLAITLAANPASAENTGGSKRGGAGFVGGAVVGAAAGGPVGMVVGAVAGGLMGERSAKKQEQDRK